MIEDFIKQVNKSLGLGATSQGSLLGKVRPVGGKIEGLSNQGGQAEQAKSADEHEAAADYHSKEVESIQARNKGLTGDPEEEEHSRAAFAHRQAAQAFRSKEDSKDLSAHARMQSAQAHRTAAISTQGQQPAKVEED